MQQSIAALACGIADDFNNILTTVLGACSLIVKDDPANSELLQYVALIRASAERAASLSGRLVCASTAEREDGYAGIHPWDAGSAERSVGDKNGGDGIVTATNRPGGAVS